MSKLSDGFETGLELVLASYKDEYSRVTNAWKDLEAKAAGVTTIGGIFLGFVLNYIKDIQEQVGTIQQVLSGTTLLCLIVTLAISLTSVKIRERVRPPASSSLGAAVNDLSDQRDEAMHRDYVGRILNDHIRDWDAAVRSRVDENATKAKRIQQAQYLLFASMFFAAVLAGSVLVF